MRNRASYVAAALSLAFAANVSATIVGSTYNFSTSVSGNTQISPLGDPPGTHTDPANPAFCVGPPVACASGSGVSGSFAFAMVTPILDTITFTFFGSTSGAGPGSFSINLGNFVTLDGETLTGISLASGSLGGATTSTSFVGGVATFTFTTGTNYNAIGGTNVGFNVATSGPAVVPEPASLALLSLGLAGLVFARRKKS